MQFKSAIGVAVLAIASIPCFSARAEDAVIVTATRFPERALDAPVGVRIITREDIEASQAGGLPELLFKFGGLYTRNNSGSPDQQIDLRGFGITGDQNTLVLLDGVRINENDLSSTRLSSIPLQSIERIEILPGSGAVPYGAGASGGTVHIITKGPQPGEKSAGVYVGAGSYGMVDTRASANIAGDRLGLALYAGHLESDGYRRNNQLRQENIQGDLRFVEAGQQVGLKFAADRQRLRLPGSRNEQQYADDPRGTATPNDYSFRDGENATLYLRRNIGRVELAADLSYRHQLSAIFNDGAFPLYGQTNLDTLAFSPRARVQFEPFGVRGEFILGGDIVDGNYKRRFAGSPAALTSPQATNVASQNSNGVFVQYRARFEQGTKLSLGWRTQRVTDRLDTVSIFGAPTDQTQSRSPKAYELALRHDFNDAFALLGKLGTSFRTATVDDNGQTTTGKLLEPQTARNRELGAEYRRAGLRLRANFYQTDLENEIYFSPLALGPPPSFFPGGANTNLSPTRRSGAEFSGSWRVLRPLELSALLNLQTATFRSGVYGGVDVSGRDVPLVPKRLAVLRASWQATPHLQLQGSVRHVGRQRYDNDQANLFPSLMPSYTLADLKLAYQLSNWRLAAGVNNLTDRKYFSYGIIPAFNCSTPTCVYPEPGRTYFASAQYGFK
ncbi:MAG: TonB-dependent receptor [Burkholderiales bacterium]|nr:TonB-dependent receptor [Burkholderiales bacterium]